MIFLIITVHHLFNKVKFSLFDNFGARNSVPVFQAFAHAVNTCGHEVLRHSMDADVAVIWSVLWQGRMKPNQGVWEYYRNSGRPVIVLEVGGLHRGHTWRVGLNGVNGSAQFGARGMDDQRAQSLGLNLIPWRDRGDYIIIATQHHNSEQWSGQCPTQQWVQETIAQIRRYSSRPIIVRSHPRAAVSLTLPDVTLQTPRHINDTYDTYDFPTVLDRAWAVVNWNSNPGIESVIRGVPAFVGSTSLAAPVANLDLAEIESPKMPDRQQWLNDLAYTEWTVEEIAQGLPLGRLISYC
jgi:hypothetical protein